MDDVPMYAVFPMDDVVPIDDFPWMLFPWMNDVVPMDGVPMNGIP